MSADAAEVSERQVQEELYRLDAYRSQLNAMLQQLQILSNSRQDHLRARETLEGLDRLDPDSELLVPVGGEVFVRGSASHGSPVLVGIGSGVVVEMDRAKATEILAQRILQIEQAANELEGQMRNLEERIQVLSQRLESMTRGTGGNELPPRDDVGGD
ncbi:MAG: prefoldin subunit alpha [Thermoplasmata archaeon]